MSNFDVHHRIGKLFAAGAIALTAFSASAQTAPAPWQLKGSDTLLEVMQQSIANAVGVGVLLPNQLQYIATGSTNGENAMVANAQSIAPMSRNLKSTVASPTVRPSWQNTVQNVIALDAAVIVSKNTASRCINVSLPTSSTDPTMARANNASLVGTFGTPGSGYDQMLEVILSGVDGSGSVAACADPRRIQALADFAACNGITTVQHFYRRDDNSGTTDTMKDKLQVRRFCNGTAVGVNGTNQTNPNLNNQDRDPIRMACVAADETKARSTCTNVATGATCVAGDTNCTQGLVVALTQPDPGSVDVTTSIGKRVAGDGFNSTFGYAGREAVRVVADAMGTFINTNNYSDDLIRLDAYMLSRRLFLAHADTNTDMGTGGGGASQLAAETALWNYMTDPNGSVSPDGAPGRCNTDPVVRQFGFLSCLDDCTATPSGQENLCSKLPFPIPGGSISALIPSQANAGTWNFGEVPCASGQTCASTGLACPATLICPAANNRPANTACAADADCATGLSCIDIGIGITTCQ